ncbi:hypothetical protein PG996_000004 [Apiospora saccharicola]|uniref:Uncharacterized protein n=1 Tax=Apiospora saccharicola TaxID=335842 RepID=A0ABR1WCI5_9PEZI
MATQAPSANTMATSTVAAPGGGDDGKKPPSDRLPAPGTLPWKRKKKKAKKSKAKDTKDNEVERDHSNKRSREQDPSSPTTEDGAAKQPGLDLITASNHDGQVNRHGFDIYESSWPRYTAWINNISGLQNMDMAYVALRDHVLRRRGNLDCFSIEVVPRSANEGRRIANMAEEYERRDLLPPPAGTSPPRAGNISADMSTGEDLDVGGDYDGSREGRPSGSNLSQVSGNRDGIDHDGDDGGNRVEMRQREGQRGRRRTDGRSRRGPDALRADRSSGSGRRSRIPRALRRRNLAGQRNNAEDDDLDMSDYWATTTFPGDNGEVQYEPRNH